MSNHNLNVNPSDLQTIVCDNCKGENFTPWITIKFLPGLLVLMGHQVLCMYR